VGTREGIEMNEKGELIVGEIDMGWSPISPVPVDAGIILIPKSHVNVGTIPNPESLVETGTISFTQVCRLGFKLLRGAMAP